MRSDAAMASQGVAAPTLPLTRQVTLMERLLSARVFQAGLLFAAEAITVVSGRMQQSRNPDTIAGFLAADGPVWLKEQYGNAL
jgi:hypothetical protein